MIYIDDKSDTAIEFVGGKAAFLNLVASLGIRIPETVVLPQSQDVQREEVFSWARKITGADSKWNLAVRSSSAQEDTYNGSNAGHFHSELGLYDEESLEPAIDRVRASGPEMAVILQPVVDAAYSGVAFGCDAVTYSRNTFTISWTSGLANNLVSGRERGSELSCDQNGRRLRGDWPTDDGLLAELAAQIRLIQEKIQSPIDIEWVVDTSGALYLVQARPVVLPESKRILVDSSDSIELLPSILRDHPKIRLRKNAFSSDVLMAPMEIDILTPKEQENVLNASDEEASAAGRSVVLLYPRKLNEKVLRHFACTNSRISARVFVEGCRRYSIRQYPDNSSTQSARRSVLQAGYEQNWLSICASFDIWSAVATGIIRRTDDGYLIDVGIGHFIPKGIIPTSTIVTDRNGEIRSANWRTQEEAFHFVDGHIVTESPCSASEVLSSVDVHKLITDLSPIMGRYVGCALEFGIVEQDGTRQAYLIDVAESDSPDSSLSSDLISTGVISVGKAGGHVKKFEVSASGALDGHLHDEHTDAHSAHEDAIVFADSPSVELIRFIGNPNIKGFVFRFGGLLAHFCVVAREAGIPVVALDCEDSYESYVHGEVVTIDATSHELAAIERVRRG